MVVQFDGFAPPPVDAALAANVGRTTKGKVQDAMGDQAVNDNEAGHNTRHKEVLTAVVKALREVWGAAVEQEPKNHSYRADLAGRNLGRGGCTLVGDVKLG